MHEAYCKDVERAFGVLQSRYAIICLPGRLWDHLKLTFIMKTVIILHNMTVEDEEGSELHGDYIYDQLPHTQAANITANRDSNHDFDAFLLHYQWIRDIHLHNSLKADLIEHLWRHLGAEVSE